MRPGRAQPRRARPENAIPESARHGSAQPGIAIPESESIRFYRDTFSRLSAPTGSALRGRFRAEFVGPFWLRYTARPSIAALGLRNWFGKGLSGPGDAHNLVWRGATLVPSLPMTLGHRASRLDGGPCAFLSYGEQSPFPFPRVVDELRAVNDDCLLGMTLADAPLLRRLAFPFLLVRSDP